MGKKFLRGIDILLLLLIVISTFSSCANEMNVFEGNNNKQINFYVSVPEWKNTDSLSSSNTSRATLITDTSFGADKSFNLIADQNDGAGNYSTLINGQAVTYTNNIWKTSNDYYWSGITNKTISFYAYYPSTISNVSHTAGSAPTLLYTVPSDASNQIDIITAINPNISGSTVTSTSLTFKHIFAAVKFAVGTSGLPSGTIKSITINGIKNSGTYTFGSGWTLSSTTSLFTVSPSTTITGANGENITSDGFTMMMIPQTFNNAIVSLVYNNGTTFSAKISGTWNAGEAYTYKLSKTIVSNYDYTGASQTFTAPYTGTYKIECWGAKGGDNNTGTKGGNGGYSMGNYKFNLGQTIYIYVGGEGALVNSTTVAGWNGGGLTTELNDGSGGGGTDLRIGGQSLNNRIIVAGGGGGADDGSPTGGYGGGLAGGNGNFGGTQTSGGIGVASSSNGSLGQGGKGGYLGPGGGGGYYGGAGGDDSHSAGGGSSYIIDVENGATIAGNSSMPSPTGGTETGHASNGYARITFVSAN